MDDPSTNRKTTMENQSPIDPFADLRDKRMGELDQEQKDRAYEKWAREQIGHGWPLKDVLEAMFRVIDRLREQKPSKMPIPPAGADALDVAHAEGWNAACDAFFGGKPAPEPLVVTVQPIAHQGSISALLCNVSAVHEALYDSGKRRTSFDNVADVLDAVDRLLRAAPEAPAQAPIDMILYCPNCGEQHIDAPEHPNGPSQFSRVGDPVWTNRPHRSHLCHQCGIIWRPADVPTNGVADIKTKGKDDTWVVYAGEIQAAEVEGTGSPTLAERGETLGAPHPDWPEWCVRFRERLAYQQGIADARHQLREAQQTPAAVQQRVVLARAMADKLMGWRLPQNFYPDGYITFDRESASKQTASWPTGTNLFMHEQAVQMLLDIMPDTLFAAAPEAPAQAWAGDPSTQDYSSTQAEAPAQAVDAAIVDSLLPECYDIINSMLATNGSLYPKDLNNRARKLLPSKYEQSFGHDRGAKKGGA